jgi:MATE family multidrug resistance protein
MNPDVTEPAEPRDVVPDAGSFRHEARELVRLAWPLALSFTGNTLLTFVATALVGRADATELAGVSVANGLYFTVSVTAAAVVFGMDPLVAQAIGAGEGARARATLRSGVRLALALSVVATAIVVIAPLALPALGIDPSTIGAARRYLWARAPGTLPLVLQLTLRGYLQARNTTRPIFLGMLAANAVNLLLCAPLTLGDRALGWIGIDPLGLPALGAFGAGLSVTLGTWAQLAVIALGVRALPQAPGLGSTAVPTRVLLRLGFPIALTVLAEIGAFTIAGVLAGRIGPAAASGHQVALSLASLTFTASMAIGDATSVRVGHAVGRGDGPGARRAGFAGLTASTVWMSFTALVFVALGGPVARLVTDQPDVLAVAVPLLGVAAAFQLFDGAQTVGAGALRGLGDTRPAQWANLVGYYVVGLPLAAWLAFSLGIGAEGLWWGLCAGLFVVATTLVVRFERKTRGSVERIE